MFNETAHSGVVRERLLPCRFVVTAKWIVSCTRITCIQPLSRCSLTLFASSFFSESVVVFSLFSPSFSPCVLLFFIFGLLAISYPLVIVHGPGIDPPPPSPPPPRGIFGDNDFWIAQYVSFQYLLVCKMNYSAFRGYLRWYIAA